MTRFDFSDEAFLAKLEEDATTDTERKYAAWLRRNAIEEPAEVIEMQASLQAIVKSWLVEQAKAALEAVPQECKGIHLGLLQVAEVTAALGDNVEAEKMGQAAVDGCTRARAEQTPAQQSRLSSLSLLASQLVALPSAVSALRL